MCDWCKNKHVNMFGKGRNDMPENRNCLPQFNGQATQGLRLLSELFFSCLIYFEFTCLRNDFMAAKGII